MATFHAHARDVLNRSLAREGTLRDYRRLLGHAQPVLGGLHTGRIRRQDVERALALSAVGLAPKSVKNLLAFIKLVLQDAGNDCARSIRVRVPQGDVRAMSPEEAARFQAALPDDDYGRALRVLLRTGLRVGELLGLRPHDYDAEQCQLQVLQSNDGPTKSGRHRQVDVPKDVAPLLALLAARGGRRLFPNLAARTMRHRMAKVCEAAGLRPFRVHDLRHTRCTHLLLAGVPVLYVSKQAGHSSPAFTMKAYGHLLVAGDEQRHTWANA